MKQRRRTDPKHEKEEEKTSDICKRDIQALGDAKLGLLLIIFRLINACVVRTWFVPDEYWQGPEVAHNLVFGYGYLTWEWKQGLRGYTLPLFYSAAYKFLETLGMDTPDAVIFLPNALQSVLAAVGDFYLYKLANKEFGKEAAKWALLCNLLSWFSFYCITRTLSNSTETVLTTMALYYWPLKYYRNANSGGCKSSILTSLSIAAVSCIIRPTSAVIWILLSVVHLMQTDTKFRFVFIQVIPVGLFAILFSVAIDTLFYGTFTFVPYNFILFNVVKNLGTFYGTHPWHWYFSQGFPAIMFTHLPLFIAGVFKAKGKLIAALVLWVLLIYSFLDHKEFRFILPVLPMCMCYCGNFLSSLTKKTVTTSTCKNYSTMMMIYLCATNVPIAVYTSVIHQKGVVDVMTHLRHEAHVHKEPVSVMFLMPCHSTPFYSHMHQNIKMRFLECPPKEDPQYLDEAAQFYTDPMAWLNREFPQRNERGLPSHVVMFSSLAKKIKPFLFDKGYRKVSQ